MLSYWGKAHINDSKQSAYHPLVYHSLDVAATCQILLLRDEKLLKRLSICSKIDESLLVSLSTFFLALHDAGKFSEGFQNLNPLRAFSKIGFDSNKYRKKVKKESAQVIRAFLHNRYPEKKLIINAFGYDMNNMKAKCWYDAIMPLLLVDDSI